MSVAVAPLPDGTAILVSDTRVSAAHVQVFSAAGVMDDADRDKVLTHVTVRGTDDHGGPVDVTVRLEDQLAMQLAAAIAQIDERNQR